MLFNFPMRIGRSDGNGHVLDQLSAYIDYELPDSERERVREHLRRCPVCETELATLKATKQLLNEMPLHPVPRSFILTPDMVGQAMSGPVERRRSLGWNLAGRLRTATAVVAVLLVLVLTGDLLRLGVLNGGSQAAMPPATIYALQPPSLRSTQSNPTTVALAEATSTTAAAGAEGAGGLGAGPGDLPIPPALPATSAAAAAPTETPSLAFDRLIPVPTEQAYKALTPPAADTTNQTQAQTLTQPPALTLQPAAEAAPAPQVSGWQLLEGALLVLLVVLGIGALWARARGV
jgi:hypothetical protein